MNLQDQNSCRAWILSISKSPVVIFKRSNEVPSSFPIFAKLFSGITRCQFGEPSEPLYKVTPYLFIPYTKLPVPTSVKMARLNSS